MGGATRRPCPANDLRLNRLHTRPRRPQLCPQSPTSNTGRRLKSLLHTPLADQELVQQAKVNSSKQFAESRDFDFASPTHRDNQGAHAKMTDYSFSKAPGRSHLVSDIAKSFSQVAADEQTPEQIEPVCASP